MCEEVKTEETSTHLKGEHVQDMHRDAFEQQRCWKEMRKECYEGARWREVAAAAAEREGDRRRNRETERRRERETERERERKRENEKYVERGGEDEGGQR